MIKYKKPISIAKGGRSLSFSNPETGEVTTVDVKEDYRLVNPTEQKAYAPAIALGALGNTAVGSTGVTSPYLAASLPAFAMSLPVALTVGSLGLGLYNEFTGNGRPTNTGALTRRFNDYTQAADATRVSSPFYRGRFLTESSDGQASEEQANESAATKEGAAAGTVSNPQEDPNKKKDKKKEEKKETKTNTFTRKITNGTNSINQFWGNRLNWWETSKNSTATPFVRGLHNFITRPIVAYEFVREGIPGGIELAKVLGGLDNTFDPRPLWGSPRLLPKIQSDSTTQDIQSNQPIQFNYSDTTQNRQMLDSIQKLEEKRSLYGLRYQNRE